MKISVIIPTYRRPMDLTRCLAGLQQQIHPPYEVIIVVRNTDNETWALLKQIDSLPLRVHAISVFGPGTITALNAGLEAAQGEVLAFTDDDAVPHQDWLDRIATHFNADPHLAGLGGRDWVHFGTQLCDGERRVIGQVQWFGRVIGNHHLGVGPPCEVDVLKGVNMSFRRQMVAHRRFDQRLLGTGAQVDNELAFCLALKREGYKLIYDPHVAVDHYRGQRYDEDQRDAFNALALSNAVHNQTLVLLEHFSPIQRTVFILWAILVGTRDAIGFLQWLRFLPRERTLATQKWLACLKGRRQGWLTWQTSKPNHGV